MATAAPSFESEPPSEPDLSHLVTEDDTPVESFFAEKQMRLLTEPLHGWEGLRDRSFVASANVGIFAVPKNPAIVPNVFLSLDVPQPNLAEDTKRDRSYFVWVHGKPPDVVIEIVSDKVGGELSDKLRDYERMRVAVYVVFDPRHVLDVRDLYVFTLDGTTLVERKESRWPRLGLGLTLWQGSFEGLDRKWLRWCDVEGHLLPTGAERADAEHQRADAEHQLAESLAAKLRALGVDPSS